MARTANVGQEQSQQDTCTGVATAFTVLSVIIVALRLYTRSFIVHNVGRDDIMMVLALIFTLGYLAAIYVARDNGMGFSGASLALVEMQNLIKVTLAIEIIYYILVFAIKVSILFVYLRLAVNRTLERCTRVTIWILTVFVVICVIVCLVQCTPLHKMWDFVGLVPGHCINTTAFFYSTSSFNIITDIWILVLPIPTLMAIQRPKREKIALVGVFSLGVFSTIASIVRLHSIRIFTESKDPFFDSVPVNLWSMIEVNIGIWCASIPALKALVNRGQRERSRAAGNSGYKYHSRDKSGNQISAKAMGGSNSNGSYAGGEEFDMKVMEAAVQHPDPTMRKESMGNSDRSGSQERIYFPGAGADRA